MGIWGPQRQGIAVVLLGYSLFLAVVLLAPTSSNQSSAAAWLGHVATWCGVPARYVTQGRVEFVANVLILMPVSALGSLLWPRTTWRDWTAYAFVIAGAVELVQGLLLPARTASFADVVANGAGGLCGALVVAIGQRTRRRSAP